MTKTVSFVLPFYNEENNLPVLFHRLLALSAQLTCATEFVFVNDGSTDGSLAYLAGLIPQHGNVRVVDLSRNFGQMTAVHAGLRHAAGDAVIIMDTDLQDRPEAVQDFIAEWERGADVVYAIRANRKESFIKRALFRSFYAVFRRLAEIPIPEEAGLFSLMDRRVVDLLVALPERNRYIPGLRAWIGFRQVGVTVERDRRGDEIPRQSFVGLIKMASDAIFSFSRVPLRIATTLGLVAVSLAVVAAAVVLYKKFVSHVAIPGWTSTLISIFFLGAVQLICLGILGEYLGRIYEEVKRRPHYVVRQVLGCTPDAGAATAPTPEPK